MLLVTSRSSGIEVNNLAGVSSQQDVGGEVKIDSKTETATHAERGLWPCRFVFVWNRFRL